MLASSWAAFATALALLSQVSALSTTSEHKHSTDDCTEFIAPVLANATNVANITLDSPGSGSLQVGPAAFDLFFRFCTPLRPTRRSKTVQILSHGGTYTHEYWNIKYKPHVYSYERAALARGYSTLSYDTLGNGKSAKPDPFDVVQHPFLTQQVISLVHAVRDGTLAPPHIVLPAFDKVVYVGHSIGSILLNSALAASPNLPVDAAVFTGFTHSNEANPVLTVGNGALQIASQTFPDRFGSLSDGYTVSTYRAIFYGPPGSYEDGALAYDTAIQDLLTVGYAFTVRFGFVTASAFSGHVLAVAGEQDATFCTQPGCANLAQEAAFYPAAASFEAQVIPNTGHVLNLHKSSAATYTSILDWLARKGF
ncbi:Alpha/Beta hydrolase protein [Auriculariales sp. MPI-PUGE-AT-0066]|nr:Alpha/Beta hydrolase protein [Auriculariales sp. MPI-PUGE-AT-0066]